MFRFLVFAYHSMYPYGGMHDISLKTNKADDVIQEWEKQKDSYDFVEVYDCQSNTLYKSVEDFKKDVR